jgi:flagellar hook-associated protein 2
MGLTPLRFTGVSQFSADFQTILERAVRVASIPLQQLQNQQANLLTKKQVLSDLRSVTDALASTVSTLGALGASKAITASSSNTNRVTISVTGTPSAGTHTISEITSVATAAAETTLTGFATVDTTAVSGTGAMELVVGSNSYTKTLGAGENNLNAIRDWINGLGAGITASVLNTGDAEEPYYLYLSAASTGATTLQLRTTDGDAGSNILTATNQGTDAVFKLNGIAMSRPQNTIADAIPGVSFTIVNRTDDGETVTLALSSSRAKLSAELNSFAVNYNNLVKQLNAQIGESAGLLTGDSIIRETQQALRAITGYTAAAGTVRTLADLGIAFDTKGVMTFNATTFNALSDAAISSAFDFLGSAATGFGAMAGRLTQISDPITGMIRSQQDQIDTADQRITKQIEAMTARIEVMQKSVSEKLQIYDTLLARLESKQTMIEASYRGLELVLYGKKDR